jgi:hypothetical protein
MSAPTPEGPLPGRTPSEERWLRVNAYLNANRHELALRAAGEYPAAARVAGTPLLAGPAWRPPGPLPLQAIRLEFSPDVPPPAVPDLASLAPHALPERADGHRYQRFSQVIAALAAPAVFENRPVYRLLSADLADPSGPRLVFGRGRFFDGVDVGGAAGHEYAAWRLGMTGGCAFREAIGDPSTPATLHRRPAALATSALTLRYDRAAGTATFPVHYRDPALVGHAGGMYQVIPVGIFQPSAEAPGNESNDFDLWRGLLREYAEELLGTDEDHNAHRTPVCGPGVAQLWPIDYSAWPLAKAMTDGLADGSVRAWCVGLGTDPLTFATDLLVVVVIDAPLYDELFADAVSGNAEGRVISPRPFAERPVRDLLTAAPFQAAAEALLTLALTHRDTLLAE